MQSPISPVTSSSDTNSDASPISRGSTLHSKGISQKDDFPNVGAQVGYWSGGDLILCEVLEIIIPPRGSIHNGFYMLSDLHLRIARLPFKASGSNVEYPYSKLENE